MPRGNWNRLYAVDWPALLASGDKPDAIAAAVGCSLGLVYKYIRRYGRVGAPAVKMPLAHDPLDTQLNALLLERHGKGVREWLSCCERRRRG